jgi:hypothetical protein
MRVKTWITGLLAVAMAVSLTACKPLVLNTTPDAEAAASAIYADIAAGRVAAIQARFTPEAAKAVTPEQILSLRPFAETTPPKARRLITMEVFNGLKGGPQTQKLTYELSYPGRTVLYRVTLKRPSATASWQVEAVNLNKATDAQLANGGFTLAGRSPAQLAFLAATILSPALMLIAIVTVIRAPGLKRKWLWVLVALVGVGSATMNWTTGQAGFQPLSVNLIGAGITKQDLSNFFPWILKFTPPLGAVIALAQAAMARRRAKQALDAKIEGF